MKNCTSIYLQIHHSLEFFFFFCKFRLKDKKISNLWLFTYKYITAGIVVEQFSTRFGLEHPYRRPFFSPFQTTIVLDAAVVRSAAPHCVPRWDNIDVPGPFNAFITSDIGGVCVCISCDKTKSSTLPHSHTHSHTSMSIEILCVYMGTLGPDAVRIDDLHFYSI